MDALKDKQTVVKWFKGLLLCLCNLILGIGVSILGPSIFDIQLAVGASSSQAAYIIWIRGVGILTGSVFGNFFNNPCRLHLMFVYISWNYAIQV